MDRAFNFSAGPSMLPLPVLNRAAAEMTCYGSTGMSVMEMSHRSAEFRDILEETEGDLRKLMDIPGNYKVLFLQGGASMQFASVPLNLAGITPSRKVLYALSGHFSAKAYKEAQKLGFYSKCIATTQDDGYDHVPEITPDMVDQDASYLHICFNNTMIGTKYPYIPETGRVPLVADMSSCIVSEPIDVSRFGAIYAGTQKNIAPAGMAIVIVRDDLLGKADEKTPTMLDWKIAADNSSMYNTPPCYTIYMAGLVFKWILETGGLEAMRERNLEKAGLLYDYLDSQNYYTAPVKPGSRSVMNVTFATGDEVLDKKFADEASENGLKNLSGHRSVGGLRASIYNAMPIEGVERLVSFMKEFAASNPKN